MKAGVRALLLQTLPPEIAGCVPKSRLELRFLLKYGRPLDLVYFGIAPGDDILCTAVIHELAKRCGTAYWMMSNHPEIFASNPQVKRVIPYEAAHLWVTRQFGRSVYYPNYTRYNASEDRSQSPEQHIIAEMCAVIGLSGKVALRPHYYGLKAPLQAEEDLIVMQSAAQGAAIPIGNKEWYPERFADVCRRLLAQGHRVVQVGTQRDPPLPGAEDVRGRTSIAALAELLGRARLFIGQVGFVMHLARAVECPGVIVYGGREAPWQSGYVCNENLHTPMPCAPCWKWNRCEYGRECMKRIEPGDVVSAAQRLLARPRAPLAVEKVIVKEALS